MTVYLVLVLVLASAAVSAVLTPLVSRGAGALGLVDAPGGRKVHARPVPRLGGIAVVLGATVALAAVLTRGDAMGSTTTGREWFASVFPILSGASCVFVIGLLDDVRPISPWAKLLAQGLSAGIAMSGGLLIERVTVLGVTWTLGWTAWLVTAAWIVGLTNAFNLIDGVDGLAAGIAAIAGAGCTAILVARGHLAEALLLGALVGSALGFLLHNFPPASIFLGDGGSLLFGFVLATTAIAGWQKGATALAAGVPLLIFAVPLADLVGAIGRRARFPDGGTRTVRDAVTQVLSPDRGHIHHRMLALGWSSRRTVLILYLVTIVLSALALATAEV